MKIMLFKSAGSVLLAGLLAGCGIFGGSAHPAKDRQLEKSFQLNRKRQMDVKAFDEALNGGADPNMEMKNGATPLIMAVVRDRPDLIEKLLKRGADINKPSLRGGTPLHIAAGLGRKNCLNLLIQNGAKINTSGAYGRTPLMDAARLGNLEIVEELLDSGADLSAVDSLKRTALMHAAEARENSFETVRLLISNGADPMAYDADLKIAAMHAAALKHTDAAIYLMELVPDLSHRPALLLMVLHSAILGSDLKLMEWLIDRRPPLNRSLSLVLKGTTILQVHGFYRILIRNGLLGNGRVPLHWAARENNLEAAKLLISRGADPLQPDELGNMPDELATSREVVQYLQQQQKIALESYSEKGK